MSSRVRELCGASINSTKRADSGQSTPRIHSIQTRGKLFPIFIRDATKVYEGGVEALRGVTLECAAGTVTALVGRSGCGKTTLLNLCGAMDFPTSGEVLVAGADTSKLNDSELTRLRRTQIGFV